MKRIFLRRHLFKRMKFTPAQLKRIIREEVLRQQLTNLLSEAEADALKAPTKSTAGSQKVEALEKANPTSASDFSAKMKMMADVIKDLDVKEAKLDASQLQKYWSQFMSIFKDMAGEEKTSSTETGKVAKALGQ